MIGTTYKTAAWVGETYGLMSTEEIRLLQRCINNFLPRNPIVVNIGAGQGTSACAIFEVRPHAFIFSVDNEIRLSETENLLKCGFSTNCCLRILSDSASAGEFWPIPLDLLIVDGDHEDAGVRADIEAWLPSVKNGGLVAFHDYKHREWPGLTGIVDRAMAQHEYLGEERYLIVFQVRA